MAKDEVARMTNEEGMWELLLINIQRCGCPIVRFPNGWAALDPDQDFFELLDQWVDRSSVS